MDVLLWWSILGLKLAHEKGHLGECCVDWYTV